MEDDEIKETWWGIIKSIAIFFVVILLILFIISLFNSESSKPALPPWEDPDTKPWFEPYN